MNNSTSANIPNPSQPILLFNALAFIVVSVLGIIGSAITVVTIVASKPLHSPCFTLIAGGGIGSMIVATYFLTRGIDKLGVYVGAYSLERTGLQCLLLVGILGISGIAFHSQMTCVVAIDRLICVTAPIKYRQLGKRYAMIILTTCTVAVTLQEIICFATAPSYNRVVCNDIRSAVHPVFEKTYVATNLFYDVVNILAYIAVMISFRFRHVFSSGGAQDSFMKQQLAVMPTVKLIVFLYLITAVLAEVLIHIGGHLLTQDQPAFILKTLGGVLKDASSLVEGFSLFVRNKKFRDCFLVLIGRKPSAVAPMRASSRNR